MPSKEQSHGSQHDVDIRTSAPLVLQTNVGTSAPAINTGKVEKSLLFALGRVVRRHHPTLAEDAENIQHDHWSKVSYLSDVRERFIYSDRTSLTRSFSEMDMRTMNMRRVARKAHYRANSFSMFEDDMTRGHAYLTDDTSLFAEDTADWVPSREIEPTQITDVYDQDYSSDEVPDAKYDDSSSVNYTFYSL